MKFLLPIVLALSIFTSGCSLLMPKSVELFQKKVQRVPELSEKGQEYQRQAADYLASHDSTTNRLAGSLSTSLGPPARSYTGDPYRLGEALRHQVASKDEDVRDYAERADKLAGKKIEGTGLLRIPYFAFIGLIVLGFMLLWGAVRAYGLVNPVVGTASGVIGRISATVLHNGFSELVAGGQQFVQWVENSNLTAEMKQWIVNTFEVAHQTQQSKPTQDVVDKMLVTTTNNTSAPLAPPTK